MNNITDFYNKIKQKFNLLLIDFSFNKSRIILITVLSVFTIILTVYMYYYIGGRFSCWKKFGEIEQGYKYSVISGCKVKTNKGFIPEKNYNFRDTDD
jgi:hypothetical protein